MNEEDLVVGKIYLVETRNYTAAITSKCVVKIVKIDDFQTHVLVMELLEDRGHFGNNWKKNSSITTIVYFSEYVCEYGEPMDILKEML